VLVGEVVRFDDDLGTLCAGPADALVDVGNLETDIENAVAMPAVVVKQGTLGADAALDHEATGTAGQHERLVVFDSRFWTRVANELHPEGRLIEAGGLRGVAHNPHDGIPAGDGERVVALVVLDETH
jgi:hypothetical protein